ncbi:MAG: aminoacetone oxidase family FAD-binding enzyme, partial [Clostridia bacterium]|nr:aminoacetone oxidase family FAD-binding enzyme [Clostridia bacterium]
KAVDIVDALYKAVQKSNIRIVNDKVEHIVCNQNRVSGIKLNDGDFDADSVIIATGGLSYPLTGSTGDGYRFAKETGHTVTALNKKPVFEDFGEMLFTHFGISGPLVLSASSHIKEQKPENYYVSIDLKPALNEQQLDARILRDFDEFKNKDFANSLDKLLPKSLIPVVVKLSGIDSNTKVNQISREQRQSLCKLLKSFKLTVTDFRPIEEAIITDGGVSVKDINPTTMESKIIDGLYFAGEVIDLSAYTGGFNLQIAFSTGYTAGKNA